VAGRAIADFVLVNDDTIASLADRLAGVAA
jgi:hypothetical protein